ncbi:MAG: ABC transporter permease [Spirochaetaceae bacterium]|nr:ABC transporter permease [Spirochaetaceae bacterium]
MIGESLRMAFESFAGNRLRAALSLVGVVIGVASVVAVTALSESGAADVRRQFEAFGLDAVQVFSNGNAGAAVRLDEALADEILRAFPETKAVLPKATLPGSLSSAAGSPAGSVVAVDSRYFAAMDARVALGAAFSPSDEYRARPVVVLGAGLARELFPEGSPIGKTVSFSGDKLAATLQVVGVLEAKESRFMDDWDRGAFLPFRTAALRYFGGLEPQVLSVVARDRRRVVALGEDLRRFFLDRSGDPEAFWISSPKEWAEENEKMIRSLSLLLGGVAAISLLVGGIGIMNIMLVSVTERKREIGVRKALGATRRHIRAQFMVEAAVLTLSGGVLGLALGMLAALLAVKGFGWAFVASPGTALLAMGVSAAVGLFSGIYPAVRAARLDPVEALAAE